MRAGPERARPVTPGVASSALSLLPNPYSLPLPDRALHLQLDQSVQLDRVLERQFLGDGLDEAVDDHGHGLLFGEPATHEVEELVLADLRDGCLVLRVDLLLLDLDVRISVRPRVLVEKQRVALDPALGVDSALVYLEEPAVRAPARPPGDGLGGDEARSIRRGVDDLAAGVLVLAVAGVGDGEDLTPGALAEQVDSGVLHRELRAQVAVDPLDGRVLVGRAPLGNQVVGVVRPVLDGRVPDARARLRYQLDDRRMERVRGVGRGRAALDVVDVRALVGDDERPLELAHVLRVDTEVRLKRDVDVDPRRDVHERSTRPDRGVERRELVVVGRDDGPEVLAHEVLVLAQAAVHVHEDDAALLPLLLERVVDDLGLVLRPDAGERLALGLRDAQLVESVLDIVGHVVPGTALVLHRPDVVVDLIEVQVVQVAAPLRGRLLVERLESLQPKLEHPLGLVLVLGDHGDDLRVDALPGGLEEVFLRVPETVLVLVEPELLDCLVFWHIFPLALCARAELLAHPLVALVLQLQRQVLPAAGYDPAVEHDVDAVRLDVPQD